MSQQAAAPVIDKDSIHGSLMLSFTRHRVFQAVNMFKEGLLDQNHADKRKAVKLFYVPVPSIELLKRVTAGDHCKKDIKFHELQVSSQVTWVKFCRHCELHNRDDFTACDFLVPGSTRWNTVLQRRENVYKGYVHNSAGDAFDVADLALLPRHKWPGQLPAIEIRWKRRTPVSKDDEEYRFALRRRNINNDMHHFAGESIVADASTTDDARGTGAAQALRYGARSRVYLGACSTS